MKWFKKKIEPNNKLIELLEEDMTHYANLINSFKRGSIEVLHFSDKGFVIYETIADYYAIDEFEINEMIPIIEEICKERDLSKTVLSYDENIMKYLREKYQYPVMQECAQLVYTDKVKKFTSENYVLSPATLKDKGYIEESYEHVEKGLIDTLIQEGNLFILRLNDSSKLRVGYIGIHPDTSIGFEYIEPAMRRKGAGTDMITLMLAICQNRGMFPFIHVLVRNRGSVILNKKIGFKMTDTSIYWLSKVLW